MGDVVKKKFELKVRNIVAMDAWMRNGAGQHKDLKQDAKIHGCDPEYWDDELQDYWQSKESVDEDSE